MPTDITLLENPGHLIIGAGVAGLFTALKLAPAPVTVLTPAPLGMGTASAWAQGGIAAALGADDSAELHALDTIAAGAGLVDETMARILAEDARGCIEDLSALGVDFDRDATGAFQLGKEAAHSRNRIVHVRGDMAGAAITAAVTASVGRHPHIRVLEGWEALELISDEQGVRGAVIINKAKETRFIPARNIVLATGGSGTLYATTTNPSAIRGQGLGLAARAGAIIADAEFMQFHPTALAIGRDPVPLATEALRGAGAVLINETGERFLSRHPQAELAPRDVVARAVHAQILEGHTVYLDAREAIGDAFAERFPTVYAVCMETGLDPSTTPIPVAPAAHYHVGGVSTDHAGRSSLHGLWVCGEVACTGVHGANRLASNSLLETLVMGKRIAADILAHANPPSAAPATLPSVAERIPTSTPEAVLQLRQLMLRDVGILRSRASLTRALTAIRALEQTHARDLSFFNMLTASRMIVAAALLREESRGCHYRDDFPDTDPTQRHRRLISLADAYRL